MKPIIDNFSENASTYFKFRPVYPENLYAFIYSHLKDFDSTWDCGTGNGQVAYELSHKFKSVYATDISDAQLKEAASKPNIYYSKVRAEETNFPDHGFDLITVGQAAHWFDLKLFFKEVFRVGKSGGLIAIWGYNLLKINPEVDEIISDFYTNTVGDYWDAERKLVEDSYTSIDFPFKEIQSPPFEIETEWNYEQLLGYLSSWSSVNKYKKVTGKNPLALINQKLLAVWGDKETYIVKFPLFLRLGKIKNLNSNL